MCDRYFVNAVEIFAKRCKLSDDVAGATLLAMGTSAPELLSALVGVFSKTPGTSDIGTGTVVGSLIFNTTVILGCCAIATNDEVGLRMNGYAAIRDFYSCIASITMLALVFRDGEVSHIEAVLMLVSYLLYVLLCLYFENMLSICLGPDFFEKEEDDMEGLELPQGTSSGREEDFRGEAMTNGNSREGEGKNCGVDEMKSVSHERHEVDGGFGDASTSLSIAEKCVLSCGTYPPTEGCFGTGNSVFSSLLFIMKAPLLWAFAWTVPDCKQRPDGYWYLLTLFSSTVWLALLIYVMIEWAEKFGCLLNIHPSITGLTLCAAGTSAPDCFASIIVARSGKSRMAVSNVFGSNIFDVLFALGLPWTVYYFVNSETVLIDAKDFDTNIWILLLFLCIVFLCVAVTKCVPFQSYDETPNEIVISLRKWSGPLLLSLYVGYVIFVVTSIGKP
eukprot:g3899.t1